MESNITTLLEEARQKILEASRLVREVRVSEKVGENYEITPEFEEAVQGVYNVKEAVNMITTDRKESGSLDELEEYIKNQLKEFFKENYKQKRYEGDLMEIGYRVTERKSITDDVDERFVKIEKKPNTEVINEYIKATRSDENPDGILPKGVISEKFEYISYKPVINEI